MTGPYSIIVTGVGGTGVVTIGAILGMAAHLEGKGCGMIDMAGLAQKGGAVYSHVKLAPRPEDIHAIRVAAGDADLVLGCDLVVTGTKKVLASVKPGATALVVNTAEIAPGDFTRQADYSLPVERIRRAILAAAGPERAVFVDATATATALLGNALAANMFLLGHAFQQGRVPLSSAAIERAIELNGEAVAMNLAAFRWGRQAGHRPDAVATLVLAARAPTRIQQVSQTLEERIARRVAALTAYQDVAYAATYREAVERARAAEASRVPGQTALVEAVARYLFKLMAYKDEYEVARLYTDGEFARQVAAHFDGADLRRAKIHLAPPVLARRDPGTGLPRKGAYGPWVLTAMRVLARMKRLRGTWFDPFGHTHERRTERALIVAYRGVMDEILANLTPANHALAVAILSIPEKIRGFGHVKARHLAAAKAEEAELLARFRRGDAGAAPAVAHAAE